MNRPFALMCLLILTGLGGCAVNPVTGDQNFVLMSENQEISMGRTNHPKIIEQFGRYDDRELQAYIQRIGERISAASHRENLVYRFTILDSADVNAFALPGGYIYITRGMLAYISSEEELAAVLGHEIGHVTARHSVRQYTAQQAASIGATLGSILIPELGTRAAQTAINILGTSLLRGYGREHELEADRLGAEYLARGGYNPDAMINVIGILKDQEEFAKARAKQEGREAKTYHGVFATHPDNDTRLQEVVGHAARFKSADTRPAGHLRYLRAIDEMTFGDATEDGVIRGRNFYHLDMNFRLEFPPHWKIENKPDRIVAYSPGRDALLQVSVTDINKRITPRQFLRDRLRRKNIRDGESVSVNGLTAYTATAESRTPFGQRRIRIAVVFKDKQAFVFAGAVKDKNGLGTVDRAFRRTVFSLDKLRDADRSLARSLKLHRVKPSGKDWLPDLVKRSALGTDAEDRLRLLNGLFPGGDPAPGQWLKFVH